ncbi:MULTISPECIES: hypothetical protein [Capnocytophaga]|uniref:hypothetical protein n=1 Tax=Capnocytophaga TaxID=1016 RepID=UPI000D6E48A3|nr:hypothetical protein [Capnocytophaga canimorsus]AWL79259.1 hypothetical protein DKB58_10090 [Capnocytophaga canimorsus]AYW37857.1 hypothetical protein D8L92_11580 [Capnocytophaga canimorsus]MDT9498707.1 hypothetical protein [Capnocytophaga canimorsus]GIM58640.1 hypothetical protein CAPN007_08470 [Capnocytophaga canimorsus]
MRNIIKPFEKVGELKFGMDRNFINTSILKKNDFDSVQNKNIKYGGLSINDYFKNGLVLGYLQTHLSLRYVVLSDPCEAIFEGEDLLAKTYSECLEFMKQFDSDIEEEEYVGFTSYKLGIAIYAPNATDDPDCNIEAVTVGEVGYFQRT